MGARTRRPARRGKSGEKVGDETGDKESQASIPDWVQQVNECVPALDEGVGQLMAALKETGQLENTLVVYTADQGFAMGEHGLRMKIAPYDASYRSPLIVSRPGTLPREGLPAAGQLGRPRRHVLAARRASRSPGRCTAATCAAARDPETTAWAHPMLMEHMGTSLRLGHAPPSPPVPH